MNHCQKHKFTKEQHEKAQAAFFKFKEEAIYLKEAVELAQLNYKKVMSNSESTEKDYKAAADKVVESTGKALAAKLAFKSTMAHQVFSAEQRKCPFCSKRHEHHKELEEESEE